MVRNDQLMASPSAFILPLKGLGKGFYEYDLRVTDTFFQDFPESPIQRAAVDLHLTVDKQSREMVIECDFAGSIATNCDRCLADIDLPIADHSRVIVKFAAEEDQQDQGEIVYLHPDTNEFDLAPLVYEMVVLAVPMIRTYACREGEPPYPCDEDLLDRIDGSEDSLPDVPEDEAPKPSPWDVLKDLSNN